MSISIAIGTYLGKTGRGAAASVGAIAPASVSGLAVWLKADALSLNDGDPVSTWADSSGNGRDFTGSGANRPTYKTAILNGKPVVRFASASTQFLNSASVDLTGASGVTVFIVTNGITANTNYCLLEHSTNTNNVAHGFYLYRTDTTNNRIEMGTRASAAGSYAIATSDSSATRTIVTTSPRLVAGMLDLSRTIEEASCWINGNYFGGLEASGTGRTDNDTGTVLGNFAFYLGARGGTTDPLSGDIAEVLVYSRALSARERARVSWWLNDKYDLFA